MLIAVLDASVLYPAPLRDFLMHLAVQEAFYARWTNQIHDEWTRNVLKNRPDLTSSKLERTRNLMNTNARNSLVSHYEPLIETLTLPDPDDRHVLAAAIRANADVIVTANLRHFPKKTLAEFKIRPLHPDDFILELLNIKPEETLMAFCTQRDSLFNPPVTTQTLLATLEQQGLQRTTQQLLKMLKK
jgi:predicted nucleic acid-binding protein